MAVDVPCLLCGTSAVAFYFLDRGCVARPDAHFQPLCFHHENRATPIGSMELLLDLRRSVPAGQLELRDAHEAAPDP